MTPAPRTFTPQHRGGSGPPLVLLHGFTDTWRTWELALPALERAHDVLAPTLAGHAGGPALPDGRDPAAATLDAVERAMDEAGFGIADLAGVSLGGWAALALAARGRARTVTAFAPAGGWATDDADGPAAALRHFETMQEEIGPAVAHAELLVATPAGRRRITASQLVDPEPVPPGLLAHQIRGVARCTGAAALIAGARASGWPLDAAAVTCPVRIVWGREDRMLPYPVAARRWLAAFPHADWVLLDDVGHGAPLDAPLEVAQLVLGTTGG